MNDRFNESQFSAIAGFSGAELALLISTTVIVLGVLWGAWAVFSTTASGITQGRMGKTIGCIAGVVLALTLVFIIID